MDLNHSYGREEKHRLGKTVNEQINCFSANRKFNPNRSDGHVEKRGSGLATLEVAYFLGSVLKGSHLNHSYSSELVQQGLSISSRPPAHLSATRKLRPLTIPKLPRRKKEKKERKKTSGLTRMNFLTSVLKSSIMHSIHPSSTVHSGTCGLLDCGSAPLAASPPSWLIRAAGRPRSNSCGNGGSLRRLFIFAPGLQVVLFCNCNAPPPPPRPPPRFLLLLLLLPVSRTEGG